MDIQEAWDTLIINGFATDEELSLISTINGYGLSTLEDVLYARAGFNSFDQLDESDD